MLEEWALGVQGEVRSVVKLLYVQSPDFLRCVQVTSAPTWEDQTAEGAWGSPVEERPASSGPNMWMISFNPHSTPARFLFVLFSCQAMSDSSPPHGLQHASLPCPLPFPRVCPKFMSVESVMPSNHLILCLYLLPSVFPSIRVFSSESAVHIRCPKYWSLSFSIGPFSEFIVALLAVQGILKSLLQHQSLKASLLRHSASLRSSSHIHT